MELNISRIFNNKTLMLLPLSFGLMQPSFAGLAENNTIFNWAEQQFPQYFSPAPAQTQQFDIWDFRQYNDIYLGINNIDEVYVMGGQFGPTPVKVGTVAQYLPQAQAASNSGNTNNGATPGNGNCVTIDFPRAGIIVNAAINANGQSGTTTITYHNTNATNATATIVTNVAGNTATIESETRHKIENGMFYELEDKSTTKTELPPGTPSIPGGANLDSVSTTTYSPARFEGPALSYCEGQTWTEPAVTATTVSTTFGMSNTSTSQTSTIQGKVEAVNETITVPAGTFNTIRESETDGSGDVHEMWTSIEHSVVIKHVTTQGGQVISTLEATSIQ